MVLSVGDLQLRMCSEEAASFFVQMVLACTRICDSAFSLDHRHFLQLTERRPKKRF